MLVDGYRTHKRLSSHMHSLGTLPSLGCPVPSISEFFQRFLIVPSSLPFITILSIESDECQTIRAQTLQSIQHPPRDGLSGGALDLQGQVCETSFAHCLAPWGHLAIH